MPNLPALIQVFEEARRLLALPDNNFDWSGWDDHEEAIGEVDEVIAKIKAGEIPRFAQVLFLPTGPLQEVSLSSGWGDEFVDLADLFDEAMKFEDGCPCTKSPRPDLQPAKDLGMDSNYAEVTLHTCPDCGRHWLRYFYENEAFTKSGRWYIGIVLRTQASVITAEDAKPYLERLPWYFYGGSYYDGKVGKGVGPIQL